MKEKKLLDLSTISEEELLNLKICELPLKIEGTWLQSCVGELYQELERKGIKFKPPCYLADEWLTPDGEPVIGIPFFLAHPTLMKLEKKMMLDVEGGTKGWCMKLLRHESGHAINYAYRLYRRRKWQKIFGKFSKAYLDTYRFRPYSKSFVRHLEDYYAQYHPDEDFAETFAVWLTPGSNWRETYKGWKALEKLNYVEELIEEIKEKPPLVRRGRKYWHINSLRVTLKNYYKKKRLYYAEYFPDFHDVNLKKIFTEKSLPSQEGLSAKDLIKKYRKQILSNVSEWTGEKKYVIADLLDTIEKRCKSLNLNIVESESSALLKFSTYITTLIMNYRYTGRFQKIK